MIYLNSSSTTKPDKEVLDDFMCCAENIWHNPSDINEKALNAKNVIRNAQRQIANAINAKPEEIIFTSGGSESNNWAIKGYVDNYISDTIISTVIEHPSVYNTCLFCEERGVTFIRIPVDEFGTISLSSLEKEMKHRTSHDDELYDSGVLVSVMFANNEIGTIQPIKKISEIVHKYNGVLHVDAVQAFMHTDIDVEELGIDMMSASFHKFGGFKNCGFLYVRSGIELTPLIHGGHQFDSKRAGTENVPMIYAMGKRVEKLIKNIEVSKQYLIDIHNYTLIQVYERCGKLCNIRFNGDPRRRLATNLSFTFKGIDASCLMALLADREIYVSMGSACSSGERTPSRILKAIGLSNEDAFSTIRIGINDKTTKEEVDLFVDALVECIEGLQMF